MERGCHGHLGAVGLKPGEARPGNMTVESVYDVSRAERDPSRLGQTWLLVSKGPGREVGDSTGLLASA